MEEFLEAFKEGRMRPVYYKDGEYHMVNHKNIYLPFRTTVIEYIYKCLGRVQKEENIMITVNAMGDNCPIPVIKTKKAMQELQGPETIEVLVDNEIAVQNVTKMAASTGAEVSSEKIADKEFKSCNSGKGAVEAGAEEAVCQPDARDNTVVVIASDRMGERK